MRADRVVAVRHPIRNPLWCEGPHDGSGLLGSLLTLNGIALASGDLLTLIASMAVTSAAYAYRISVEDAMLVSRFGAGYQQYREEVGALLPLG